MAQHDTPAHSGKAITILKVQPYEGERIRLESAGLREGGWLDPVFSAAQDNISPPLEWTEVQEAETYALVVEDPDSPMESPFVHWLLWNIPGRTRRLKQGLAPTPHPPDLPGAVQGRNSQGGFGWTGMAPPQGHGTHHYHFQLFALSKALDFSPDVALETLTNALRGNTIAAGELVGLFETPDHPSPARTGAYGFTTDPPALR